ncbi:DUF4232 domain-containing protein [Streptomyces sp. NPDC048664]|uniref:DUF4232 domain-containing protein n=1 Tax=Streptomyces sp. NPDC048664 TaxID=3154505 RepID=UPI00342C9A80
MRTIRTARTRTRTALLATAALAALTLTACDDGTGTKDEGQASVPPASSVSQGTSGQGAGSTGTGTDSASTSGGSTGGTGTGANAGTGKGSSGTSASGGKSGKGGQSGGSSSAVSAICNGADIRVTAQVVSRPLNHMLLTAKNIGSKPCNLMYYPYLRFDEMQWAPGAFKESRPQAVTTLAPGESGYAGVLLSAADGSGENGTTGHSLAVMFQGTTPGSDGGASARVSLPAKGVYYDSKLTSTYWLTSAADALTS